MDRVLLVNNNKTSTTTSSGGGGGVASYTNKDLLDISCWIETRFSNGPLDRLDGKLRTEVQLLVGKQL